MLRLSPLKCWAPTSLLYSRFPRLPFRGSESLDKVHGIIFRYKTSGKIPFYGAARDTRPTGLFSLSPLQRISVAVHSATTALADPSRADAVAALGEVTGHMALYAMYDKMMLDPTGQRILRDRPIVDSKIIDLNALLKSDEGTFGHVYAKFMQSHGFDPDERSNVRFISDPELSYIMLRYGSATIFGMLPPTVLGELALKWVELLQTGLPVAALSATVGSLRLSLRERDILHNIYLPWAVQVGKNSTFLMNTYYEGEFETNIHVLRERIGIEPAPDVENWLG
eukprot:CAMPEP_0113594560 /NCGR_PEP_ID=MMETSP0015_2-20120614/39152_1 /TAXON_ID=2838 /ORGANISM="Odontella" /LENGTH=281 /DNA_ID=CAMNT_0000501585 /DNA_START=74 /DNA_END=920 /DNA_ORIENTATION=- /assembly_acc=CAM_ASM_000160